MDLELYVSDKVDKLGLPLNFRQRNFLEGLMVEAYSKGNELAHSVMGKGAFESQALPVLKEVIIPLLEQRESLEKLSIGDWVGVINTKNLLHNIRDRFFSRNAAYTHREDLQLHDLVDYENQIVGEVLGLTEEGLLNALEEWCQNKLMTIAGDELQKSTTPALKTKVGKPLVNHNAEASVLTGLDVAFIRYVKEESDGSLNGVVSQLHKAATRGNAEYVQGLKKIFKVNNLRQLANKIVESSYKVLAGDVIDFKKATDRIRKDEGSDIERAIKKWSGESRQLFKRTNKKGQWILRSPVNNVWVILVNPSPGSQRSGKDKNHFENLKDLEKAYKKAMEEKGLEKLYYILPQDVDSAGNKRKQG